MNDRFLFHGKRIDNGEWITGCLCFTTAYEGREPFVSAGTLKSVIAIQYEAAENYYVTEAVDPATVGRCTGLKDKNDKLIFEGDIVRGIAYSTDFVGYIIWIDKIAGFGVRFFNFHRTPTAWENCSILKNIQRDVDGQFKAEIIGNIHDNPELLNGAVRIGDEHAEQNGLQYAT